jgi:hypothetical protein
MSTFNAYLYYGLYLITVILAEIRNTLDICPKLSIQVTNNKVLKNVVGKYETCTKLRKSRDYNLTLCL